MSQVHSPGQTTETPRRASQDFRQPVHHLDLDLECARLLMEASINPSHRAAKTLSKDGSMTVTMIAISGGTAIMDHSTHGSALLQTLRGRVNVSLEDSAMEVAAGQFITLATRVPHRLSATVDSVVLLVVAGAR